LGWCLACYFYTGEYFHTKIRSQSIKVLRCTIVLKAAQRSVFQMLLGCSSYIKLKILEPGFNGIDIYIQFALSPGKSRQLQLKISSMNCSSEADIGCILDMSTIDELPRAAECSCRCRAAKGGSSREGSSISVLDWRSKSSGTFSEGRRCCSGFMELICMPV
jgi:hypothetical protein